MFDLKDLVSNAENLFATPRRQQRQDSSSYPTLDTPPLTLDDMCTDYVLPPTPLMYFQPLSPLFLKPASVPLPLPDVAEPATPAAEDSNEKPFFKEPSVVKRIENSTGEKDSVKTTDKKNEKSGLVEDSEPVEEKNPPVPRRRPVQRTKKPDVLRPSNSAASRDTVPVQRTKHGMLTPSQRLWTPCGRSPEAEFKPDALRPSNSAASRDTVPVQRTKKPDVSSRATERKPDVILDLKKKKSLPESDSCRFKRPAPPIKQPLPPRVGFVSQLLQTESFLKSFKIPKISKTEWSDEDILILHPEPEEYRSFCIREGIECF